MTDLEALQQIAVLVRNMNIDPALREWIGAKQMALQLTDRPRQLARTGTRGEFLAAGTTWQSRGAGAACITFAAMNPNVWINLRAGRTRRAWHAAINAAIESLARVDSGLADAFAFGEYRGAPGTHLREQDGRVQMLWRPVPGLTVDVSSP